MKKSVKFALLCASGVVVATIVYLWATFGAFVKGALSVEKLDEGMYYMEYQGDEKCLNWKLRQLDYELNFTLPKFRKSNSL